MKPQKIKIFMEIAEVIAKSSYCGKKKVGAIIVKDGHIISTGYNGTVVGMENTCEEIVAKCNVCEKEFDQSEIGEDCSYCENMGVHLGDREHLVSQSKSSPFVIHAEQNAILQCAKLGHSCANGVLFTTLSPCKDCAKLIVGAGITEVFYKTEYKDTSGLDFLRECGIIVRKLKGMKK